MAENTMLPTQKQETIAKLYALRAGLSVISENYEKIKISEHEQDVRKQEINRIKNNISGKTQEILRNESVIQDIRKHENKENKYLEETKAIKNKIAHLDNGKNGIKKGLFQILGLLSMTLISVVLWLQMAGVITIVDPKTQPFLTILVILSAYIILIADIVLTVLYFKNGHFSDFTYSVYLSKTYNKRLNELRIKLRQLQDNLDDIEEEYNNRKEKRLKSLQEEIQRIEKNLQRAIQQDEQLSKEEYQNGLKLKDESKSIYNAITSTYTPMIVEADWKNIDLLIFYLQTGRAESWKEALQLADRQTQTDQISKAIEQASASISQTIVKSTQALGSIMLQSFSELKREIRTVGGKIDSLSDNLSGLTNAIDMQTSTNKALISQGQEILSEQRLKTALLEKANKTSEELVAELRYSQGYWIRF